MKRLDEMAIECECGKVIMQYAQAVNDWDIHKFVSLFAPDGIWQRPGVEPVHGRVEMLGFMKSQSRNRLIRHVNGGYVVTVDDAARAHAILQATVCATVGSKTISRIGRPSYSGKSCKSVIISVGVGSLKKTQTNKK